MPNAAYSWQNVAVGGGGYMPDIVFGQAKQGPACLRSDMGGACRWDDRAARWIPLQDGEAESSYFGIESIAADPVDASKVYMAVGMYKREPGAILRSSDAGAHWQASPLPISLGGNEPGRGLGERLAIAPWNRATLFFGSRHDGLWRSDDGAVTWHQAPGFPYAGKGIPEGWTSNGGVAFVVCDPRPGSQRIYAGIADPGAEGIVRSDDGGSHWVRVGGGPAGLLPVQAGIDSAGSLFVTYAGGIGPNDISTGAVWALDGAGEWRDITPPTDSGESHPGFMGLAVDPGHAGLLLAASIDHWIPGDTIWLSTDGGRTWLDLRTISRRDVAATPFVKFGAETADFGHWITGLAIDPFDPANIAYTTGATVYRTADGRSDRSMLWRPWTSGVEQTAVLTVVSPTGGAPLISGFGDLEGFVHWRLDRSPAKAFDNPRHVNTYWIDYAGKRPLVVVRSGVVRDRQASTPGLAWSEDGGVHWQPLATPDADRAEAREHSGRASISVSADGARIFVGAEHGWISGDRGRNWRQVVGLSEGLRIIADKRDPALAYAIDEGLGRLMVSRDAGEHFSAATADGICPDLSKSAKKGWAPPNALVSSPFRAGETYILCDGALYRSRDAGSRFEKLLTPGKIELYGLGKGRRKEEAGIYVVAGQGAGTRLLRSLDGGSSWRRIDDPAHRWGYRLRFITGDPRRLGRVYIATDGRGIIYGDPR